MGTFEGRSVKEKGAVSWRSRHGSCSEVSSCHVLDALKIREQGNVHELGLGMVMMALSARFGVGAGVKYSAGVTILIGLNSNV